MKAGLAFYAYSNYFFRLALAALLFLQAGIINAADKDWQLGTMKLMTSEPSSGPLRERMSKGSLSTYSFVGKVGGIAFAAVAKPGPELSGKSLRLDYDREKPDGERVSLFVDNKEYSLSVPDWIIVPVARYVESDFNALVSLFGPKQTQDYYDVIYHEAFENTLIGLRLLQADTLLFNLNQTWQLPRQNGVIVLGEGEEEPRYLKKILAEYRKNVSVQKISKVIRQDPFRAWVLTDEDEEITANIVNNKIYITGNPYYYFWNADFADYNLKIEKYKQRAAEALARNDVQEHNRIIGEANDLLPTVREVYTVTGDMRENTEAIQRFNPTVFDAATKVMRYSAFFRFVKSENIDLWHDFFRKINEVEIQPMIQTPTRFPKVR